MRIVVLGYFCLFVVYYTHYCKSAVCHLTYRTYRQCFRYCINTHFKRHIICNHGGYYFRSQSRENICFYTGAESVRKHNNIIVIALLYNLHHIAAQLLAVLGKTHMAYVRAKIIHPSTTP